ncbi:relaxase/mobilization nuclease domain-containing protein [Candidatus Palauibacter sp.]|uniref:relaxase/mobilization nuclease domain-containing protein n=1 Tax=Candidatus Palauibacter sp. TaxID=3101350 RepID=UPI003B521AFE
MAATAKAAPDLKRLAGAARGGRKLAKPVLHYSLSWAQDETPDKHEMSRAVDGSLEALGLEGHEALIVAHRRGPGPGGSGRGLARGSRPESSGRSRRAGQGTRRARPGARARCARVLSKGVGGRGAARMGSAGKDEGAPRDEGAGERPEHHHPHSPASPAQRPRARRRVRAMSLDSSFHRPAGRERGGHD